MNEKGMSTIETTIVFSAVLIGTLLLTVLLVAYVHDSRLRLMVNEDAINGAYEEAWTGWSTRAAEGTWIIQAGGGRVLMSSEQKTKARGIVPIRRVHILRLLHDGKEAVKEWLEEGELSPSGM